MDRFEGRLAVITGGGTGMGRELARQLAAAQGGRIVHGTRLTPQNHSPRTVLLGESSCSRLRLGRVA